MGSSWFASPHVTTLKLSDGVTLTVKCELSAGDQRARFARMSLAGVDGALSVNRLQVGLSTITAYLVDWSLTDEHGHHVSLRGMNPADMEVVLDSLTQVRFKEILDAVDAHEEAITAEKKSTRGFEIAS